MGLTLTNGKGIPENGFPNMYGDGALIRHSQVVLKDLIVQENEGTGIYVHSSDPTFDNVTIRANTAKGIEFHAAQATGTLKRSRILDHQNEPGIFIYDTGIELDNCVVANNLKGGLKLLVLHLDRQLLIKRCLLKMEI